MTGEEGRHPWTSPWPQSGVDVLSSRIQLRPADLGRSRRFCRAVLGLTACPGARIVASFFMCERMAAAAPLPLSRLRWLEPGESLDIGDRCLHAVLPPLLDSPTTRGVYDDSTGVLWAADCFASLAPGPVHFVEEIPVDLYRETFRALNSMAAHGTLFSIAARSALTRTPSRPWDSSPSPQPTARSSLAPKLPTGLTGSARSREPRLSRHPGRRPSMHWSPAQKRSGGSGERVPGGYRGDVVLTERSGYPGPRPRPGSTNATSAPVSVKYRIRPSLPMSGNDRSWSS